MQKIIIRLVITYFFFGTIWLLNLLFNPNINWKWINKKTGEEKDVPCWITLAVCFYWIIILPKLIKSGRGDNSNE